MANIIHYDVENDNDVGPRTTLGTRMLAHYPDQDSIAEFIYVKITDLATVDGSVCTASPKADGVYTCTPDRSEDSGQFVLGVAVGVITAAYYGWILCRGYHDGIREDSGVSAADYLVAHSVDHEADTFADGEEEQVFGYALEATQTGDIVAGYVDC